MNDALNVLQQNIGKIGFTFLGSGSEGFVFADDKKVYKVLRRGESSLSETQRNFLVNALSEGNSKSTRIVPVTEIIDADETYIIVSPKMVGEQYKGGHWKDLVELLRECRNNGIALTNMHPNNFRVVNGRLIFTDIGSSIVPLDPSLWTQMIKRAYLSFKYPDRADLKILLTRSIKEDLPELNGIELFYHDIDGESFDKPLETNSSNSRTRLNVTLLIRTCYMEWATIEFQVEHLVNALEKKVKFFEKIVICGSNRGPFTRQYTEPDEKREIEALERLKQRSLIDRFLIGPETEDTIRQLSLRWFGIETSNSLSSKGEPTIDTLFGFEQCNTDLILQTDSDIVLGGEKIDETVERLIEVLNENMDCIGASLPPPLVESQEYTPAGSNGKWRTEVRFSLIDRGRLKSLLPLPNKISNGQLELSWYRSLDLRLSASNFSFYRGGDPGKFMIHVPNSKKTNHIGLYNVIKAVERGRLNPDQIGSIDLVGDLGEWLGKRSEKLVFIVRGRNTPLRKLHRCIQSLMTQKDQSFGVVFIDAGSNNGSAEILENISKGEWNERATLIRNTVPLTVLENISICIREAIDKPDAIVALLDADDALIGEDVVTKLLHKYESGADLTVGSMLRTDKYKSYKVSFNDPRSNRGGNVWQHLRTFRRYLFDNIAEEDLKVDGKWIPYAEDWAFMIPMVEMASSPAWIKDLIYLYDPDPVLRNCTVEEREDMIRRICQKKPYRKLVIRN